MGAGLAKAGTGASGNTHVGPRKQADRPGFASAALVGSSMAVGDGESSILVIWFFVVGVSTRGGGFFLKSDSAAAY